MVLKHKKRLNFPLSKIKKKRVMQKNVYTEIPFLTLRLVKIYKFGNTFCW